MLKSNHANILFNIVYIEKSLASMTRESGVYKCFLKNIIILLVISHINAVLPSGKRLKYQIKNLIEIIKNNLLFLLK